MAATIPYNATNRHQKYGDVTIDHFEGDQVVKWWFLAAVAWFPIFTSFGFILAAKFIFPNFMSDAYFTFGRLRPFHFDTLIQGFITSFLLGAMFYIVPRVCATTLRFPNLAKAMAVVWNAAVLGGGIWVLLGGSQGREYAELPWVIDIVIILVDIVLAVILLSTIARRRERKLYISTWFYMGTLVWFPVFYAIGNVIWRPPEGALNGVQDAIFNWYYGHNFFGIWITTLGLAAWYYLIPVVTRRTLYSHLMGLLSFFGIAFFYTGVGAHHLLQAPIPDYVKTIAVTMSVLMVIPVLAFSTNMFMTMRGSWRRVIDNPVLEFAVVGFIAYIVVSLQGTFQATRTTNAFLHFSQWTIGHSHLSMLGSFAFLAVALGFWLTPKITGWRINHTAMRVTFWMAFLGLIFFFLAMTILGLIQNSNWWFHINVIETLPTLRPLFYARAIAGGIVVISAFIFTFTILTSFFSRVPDKEEMGEPREVPERTEARTELPHSPPQRKSQESLNIAIVLGAGSAFFTLMTFMVVAMPYMFGPNEPGGTARPLTALEEQGESIYRANGCVYCHSQFTREEDWAMGAPSNPGDFYYSVPNFLGTERTGPTLARIGGKRPTEWHIAHFQNPRSVSPMSIMPLFNFLSADDLNALAAYVQQIGGTDLDPHGFFPLVPVEYQGKSNPYLPLMNEIAGNFNRQTQVYSGTAAQGTEWATLFEEGKLLFTRKCLPCHGGSGDGQGPYARDVLAHPANLHDRIPNYPPPADEMHFWRVSEGVPGTIMPPWRWSLDANTIWIINTYEMSFVNSALRTVPHSFSLAESQQFGTEFSQTALIAGTREELQTGEMLYGLYCLQCHGGDGKGDGPASASVPGGYITPVPFSLQAAGLELNTYGQYVWTVSQGLETTDMPPWKEALSNSEIYKVIFFVQALSSPDVYQSKWAPLYQDSFAKGLGK